MEAALWGLAGTVVGAAASIAASWIAARNETLRQTQADSMVRVERARAFQRDTLLELQETLQDAVRDFGSMMYEDHQAARQTGHWPGGTYSDELSARSQKTTARLNILTERVANDSVRAVVKDFRSRVAVYLLDESEAAGRATFNDAMQMFESLMAEIGQVLRSLY